MGADDLTGENVFCSAEIARCGLQRVLELLVGECWLAMTEAKHLVPALMHSNADARFPSFPPNTEQAENEALRTLPEIHGARASLPSIARAVRRGSGMLVLGIGGSVRAGSSTEVVIRAVLEATARRGAKTRLIAGRDLVLPPYEPGAATNGVSAEIVEHMRSADALVLGSPGYHGSVSGLVKNALDYSEELRSAERVYFDGLPVACVATAFGWQGAVTTLGALRDIVHALRGWPTPLGLAINSAEPDVIECGHVVAPALREQIELVADQLLSFDMVAGRADLVGGPFRR